MSSTDTVGLPGGRRHLTGRQADTVQGLCDAALEEVRERGYAALTVRNVARRAGVAPATAYTYFASKDHLITEVFWQQLQGLPPVGAGPGRHPAARLADAIGDLGRMLVREPQLAAGCTTAMLGEDPDVKRVRDRIGVALYRRVADALGTAGSDAIVNALGFALSGALMQAGMGYLRYEDLPDRLAEVAALILP